MKSKNNNLNKQQKTAVSLLGFLSMLLIAMSCNVSVVWAATIGVSALDIEAGSMARMTTSLLPVETPVQFQVEKPNGEIITIKKEVGAQGTASLELNPDYTKETGIYIISASAEAFETVDSSFIVHPSEVSVATSEFAANANLLALGDTTQVLVSLKDSFGNPIANRPLAIVSSRASDTISVINENNLSDENGQVRFVFKSSEEGESILSLFDMQTGKAFGAKESITSYEASTENIFGQFAELLKTDITTTGDGLSISGIPAKVKIGDTLSPTVTSLEEGYQGQIIFSSTDRDAELPGIYQFQQSDNDSHTFAYGMRFKNAGIQKVTVQDIDFPNLKVETTIEVLGSTQEVRNTKDSFEVLIDVPKTNAQLRESDLDIIGKTKPFTDLTLFNYSKSLQTTRSDASGAFYFQLDSLSDGNHEFTVVAKGKAGQQVSKPTKVFVDTNAPFATNIQFVPEKAQLGQDVIVILSTNEDSELANITTDGQTQSLENSGGDNAYTAIIPASVLGKQSIDLEFSDALGNTKIYRKAAQFEVVKSLSQIDDNTQQEQAVSQNTAVQNNTAQNVQNSKQNNNAATNISQSITDFLNNNSIGPGMGQQVAAAGIPQAHTQGGDFDLDAKLNISGLILIWDKQGVATYDVYRAAEGFDYEKIATADDSVYIYSGSMYLGNNLFRVVPNYTAQNTQNQTKKVSKDLVVNVNEDGLMRVDQDYAVRIGAIGYKKEGAGLTTQRVIPTIPFVDLLLGQKGQLGQKPILVNQEKEPVKVLKPVEEKKPEPILVEPASGLSFEPQKPVAEELVEPIAIPEVAPEPEEIPEPEEDIVMLPQEDDLVESGPEQLFLLGFGLVMIGIIYEGVWAYQLSRREKRQFEE